MVDVLPTYPAALRSTEAHPKLHSYLVQTESPPPKPQRALADHVLDWVMFDRRLVLLEHALAELFTPAPPAAAEHAGDGIRLEFFTPPSSTATLVEGGAEIRASFRLALPPACSLAFQEREREAVLEARAEEPRYWPTVLAADGGRLLMQFPGNPCAKLYVFTDDPDHPHLQVLPVCALIFKENLGRVTGLVSREDGYGVAFMHLRRVGFGPTRTVAARVYRYTTYSGDWTDDHLEVPGAPRITSEDSYPLIPDATVSHRDCIGWAFYAPGHLYMCDVLSGSPSFIRMDLPPSRPEEAQAVWKHRSVAVSGGRLSFFDVNANPDNGSTYINVWSLDNEGYIWRRQGRLQIGNCSLPHAPIFPMPSARNEDLLYVMSPHPEARNHMIYAINWRTADVVSRFSYAEDRKGVADGQTAYLGSQFHHLADDPLADAGLLLADPAMDQYQLLAAPVGVSAKVRSHKMD